MPYPLHDLQTDSPELQCSLMQLRTPPPCRTFLQQSPQGIFPAGQAATLVVDDLIHGDCLGLAAKAGVTNVATRATASNLRMVDSLFALQALVS